MWNFKDFNIANWFSFYRLVAAPLLITLLCLQQRELFSWWLLVSYSTDMVDGFLARKLKIMSPLGAQLDSLGDQVTFSLGVIGLLVFEFHFVRDNYLLIILVLVPYLIQMLLAFWKYGKATAFHTYLAKLSALLQGAFILWALFFGPVYWLFYLMIVIGVLETLEEISLIFMYDQWVSDVKGIYWALSDQRRLIK